MPTPHKFWRNDKTMEFSKLSQFGLTCKLLTENLGGELLTLYLAGFRAKTSAVPEEVQGLTEIEADYGENLQGLLARYDPDTHSLKTAQCSLFADLIESSVILHRWGILQNGALYPHPISGLGTNDKEYGLWPTPTASQRGDCPSERARRSPCLASMVKYPTPQASDNRDRGNMQDESIKRRIAIEKQIGLSAFVKEQAGPGSLSPDWTEWLMGWPIGWTDLKPLEMDKFQLWRQQHSIYCGDKL
jgi:hypothetical protein